jgi:flavin-dependent dehydrogenase
MIPDYTGPRERYADRGAFLVGDAAGLVDPLTGEGIYHAITTARLAAEAILGHDAGEAYEKAVRDRVVPELEMARRYAVRFRAAPAWLRGLGLSLPRAREYARRFVGILTGQSSYAEMNRAMSSTRETRSRR